MFGCAVKESPFCRVLSAQQPPTEIVLLASHSVAIHERSLTQIEPPAAPRFPPLPLDRPRRAFTGLWCVLEALVALQRRIQRIRIAGDVTHLLRGKRGDALEAARCNAASVEREVLAAAEKAQQLRLLGGDQGALLGEAELEHQRARLETVRNTVAAAKIALLLTPAPELIDLGEARCSNQADAAMIRNYMEGNEEVVVTQMMELIHDNVCEINPHSSVVPGPLGTLSLEANEVSMVMERAQRERGMQLSPQGVMHMAAFLWADHDASVLDLTGCRLGTDGRAILAEGLKKSKTIAELK
jgi:hypothetical protein